MEDLDSSLKEQIKNIPNTSGIYMMLDKKGQVIYIGKALNLKSRVRSYFNQKSWSERQKLHFMMPKVKEIKTVITRSENEALILEANLVNKYQPKYNVTLKDDKKFPWLMITRDEEYPRVLPIRDVIRFKKKYPRTKNKFFGPYSDAGAMWETYKILKEGFQLRLRRKQLFKDRPCMNYHLGLCSGPCQELISRDDYHKIVNQVEDFLLGKYDAVLKNLKSQMNEASKNLNYEKAAKYRDVISKINKVLEKQIVVSDDPKLSQDIFACDFNEQNMVMEVLLVREGKVVAIESYPLSIPKETDYVEAFNDGVKQYYSRIVDENMPKEILVQFELLEKEQIEKWLSDRKEKVSISCPKKGRKLELIEMARQNARLSLQKIILSNINNVDLEMSDVETLRVTSLLTDLQQQLQLNNFPKRIECFDISHLGGTGTVASMVVFVDGKPQKSNYRKFKIKSLPTGKIDDFSSMKEVISRRYFNKEMDLPNLIIIDGGKGQLSAAKDSLDKSGLDLNKIDIVSLAKKFEEIYKPGLKNPIKLERKSEVLHLIQRVRDEAHRFAITFQRDTRAKNTFESELEKIEGLGKAKIKRLMNHFGSVKSIKESDLKDFAEALGQNEENVKDLWKTVNS
jgi:excinuclease ABC subunit C